MLPLVKKLGCDHLGVSQSSGDGGRGMGRGDAWEFIIHFVLNLKVQSVYFSVYSLYFTTKEEQNIKFQGNVWVEVTHSMNI